MSSINDADRLKAFSLPDSDLIDLLPGCNFDFPDATLTDILKLDKFDLYLLAEGQISRNFDLVRCRNALSLLAPSVPQFQCGFA